MSLTLALLTGAGLPPPPPIGAGRVILHMRIHLPTEEDEVEAVYRCRKCRDDKPGEDYYWRRRATGATHRLTQCKACQVAEVARNERRRTEAARGAT